MTQDFTLALIISLAGLGLIFLMIFILWGFMALLTRLFKDREFSVIPPQAGMDELSDEQKAALLAVSIALSEESVDKPHEFPLPPTALVSAWQAVMRSNILNKRGRIR